MSDTLVIVYASPKQSVSAHAIEMAKASGHDVVFAAWGDEMDLGPKLGVRVLDAGHETHNITAIAEGWHGQPYSYVLEVEPNGTPVHERRLMIVEAGLKAGLDRAGSGEVFGYSRWALRP